MPNFTDLQAHVKRNLGNRSDTDDLIKDWINSTYLDIVTVGKIPEAGRFAPIPVPGLDGTDTFYTQEDKADYELPANALFVVSLRDTTNDTPIKQRGIRWYDRYRSTSTGPPERYARYARTIYFDPTPDAAYLIQRRFRNKVTTPVLVNGNDVPVIDQEWHDGLILGATYRGARAHNYPETDRWLRDLKSFVAAHSEQYTEEEEDADIGFSIKM